MILKSLVSPSLDGRGSGSEECSKEYHLCRPIFWIFPGALARLKLLKSGQVKISDLMEIIGPNFCFSFLEKFYGLVLYGAICSSFSGFKVILKRFGDVGSGDEGLQHELS